MSQVCYVSCIIFVNSYCNILSGIMNSQMKREEYNNKIIEAEMSQNLASKLN